jgi:hypothetical protein
MSIEQKIAELLAESNANQFDEEVIEELDEEQLDELSTKTLKSYAKKADKQSNKEYDKGYNLSMNNMGTATPEIDKKINSHMDKADKRSVGASLARSKISAREEYELDLEDYSLEEIEDFMMSEEFEQLDELSKSTTQSYLDKATKDHSKSMSAYDKAKTSDTREKHNTNIAKRSKGIAAAMKRKAADQLNKTGSYFEPKHIRGSNQDIQNIAKNRKNVKEEYLDISDDVAALTNGEDLSEEFKQKAATIFEAAVITRVKQEVAALEEEFDANLEEAVAQTQEALVEKVDGYLNYIVEQWINDNELALERGMKSEILESFVSGMKGLFEEHYIDVPEEKYDLIGDMEETIESLNSKLDEQVANNIVIKEIMIQPIEKNNEVKLTIYSLLPGFCPK